MRAQQLEFGLATGPTRAVARRTDPETSHEAARSVKIRKSQGEVLAIFRYVERQRMGQMSKTRRDVYGAMSDMALVSFAASMGYKQSESGLRSRRAELTRMGYLQDSGLRVTLLNGRRAILWERTEKKLTGEI